MIADTAQESMIPPHARLRTTPASPSEIYLIWLARFVASAEGRGDGLITHDVCVARLDTLWHGLTLPERFALERQVLAMYGERLVGDLTW